MPKLLPFALLLLLPNILRAGPGAPPLEWVENRGQWAGPARYKAVAPGADIWLEATAFTYVITEAREHRHPHRERDGDKARFHAYRAVLEGANPAPATEGSKPARHYYNYFLGNDPAKWKSGIHPVAAVDYRGVYPGVDARIGSSGGRMKYEFSVAPGADPAVIKLRYDGTDGLEIVDGRLRIRTSLGVVEEAVPVCYQYVGGERKSVPCRYRLQGTTVRYDFPRGWDEAVPLVIDPTVIFSTYSGSTADNWGMTATYDDSANFYAGGIAMANGYPTSLGAFDATFNGGTSFVPSDWAVSKFNVTGSGLVYSTYIGGSGDEQPNSLFVDAAGNLAIAGRTFSANFPTTAGAYDVTHNGGSDIAVVKLNPTGTALVGSTYLGGNGEDGNNSNTATLNYNYGDDARSEVICDAQGNVYLAASTFSTNFPTVSAAQTSLSGPQDGIVAKLNSNLTSLIWSTYLGGTGSDAAYVLALDPSAQNLYVAGGTTSNNFPVTTGALYGTYQGGIADGFIVKFANTAAYPMTRGTYMGRAGYDQCYGIQVDLEKGVYAMGQTLGGTFPVSAGVYSNPNSSQFVIKLDSNLTTNTFSTVFGSGTNTLPNISPVAFLVDTCQNIYISGWGGTLGGQNSSAGTSGLPTTTGITAPLKSTTDGNDFYFFVLSKNAINLLYGAFLGGTQTAAAGGEHVDGGTSRFDRKGVIYQAVCAGCGGNSSFPTTTGAWSTTNGSSFNCNLGATKIAFNLGAVDAIADASPKAKGCPPLVVNFSNGSSNATSYEWNFGDGSGTSNLATPTHTYTTVGTYTARLIAINPNACKVRDTVYIPIVVDTNKVRPSFNAVVVDSCNPYRVSVSNTSAYSNTPGAQGFTSFTWVWGDGSTSTGASPGIHNYPDTGTYTILLVMRDTTACNSPDTARRTVRLLGRRVRAGFNAPDSVCLSAGMVFTSTSQNASSLLWRFGNGTTSTAISPTALYATSGTYTVTLIATNPATCNKVDSVTRAVTVKSLPIADFTFAPVIPVANTPVDFTNRSQNAVSYFWAFGDGTSGTETDPSHFYKRTGAYTVCLTARSSSGCLDTVCKRVEAEIYAAVDVPTGFSPNGDGNNDVLYVRGAAIETLDFRVYNRWGELVFQTADMMRGWDGTYKGKPAEVDAYAFVMLATFVDGSSVRKTGNVTLLR